MLHQNLLRFDTLSNSDPFHFLVSDPGFSSSVVFFLALLFLKGNAMASSPSLTTITLHEPVFQQFLYDVHHSYLLLHRAMSLLPPTMIPDIEPTPLPSIGVWNQPPDLLPEYSDATNAFIDGAPLPSPDLEAEDSFMQELVNYNLPRPHQHVEAPVPDSIPAPPEFSMASSTRSKKRQAKATPKAPGKRQCKSSLSPAPSPSSPSIWTDEDKKLLRALKADEKSRFSWKLVAGKLGKPELTRCLSDLEQDQEPIGLTLILQIFLPGLRQPLMKKVHYLRIVILP